MAQIVSTTLVASTVFEAQLACPNGLEITNRDGTAEVFVSINGMDPTVGGADCYVVPAAIGRVVWGATELNVEDGPVDSAQPGVLLPVRLISTGTPKVTVRGW